MVGRYEHYDSDEYRLPEGMKRIGYDADTQIYTYRDADGSHWEGEEGNRYGRLHPVRSGSSRLSEPSHLSDSQHSDVPRHFDDFDIVSDPIHLSESRGLDEASPASKAIKRLQIETSAARMRWTRSLQTISRMKSVIARLQVPSAKSPKVILSDDVEKSEDAAATMS